MAGWVCADCSTVYSVGAPRCPHCQSTDYTEEGAMPKITEHGGPTVHVGGVAVSATWGDSPEPETAGAVTEPPASTAPAPDDEGGEGSSLGTSSSTSPEKPQTSSEPSSSEPPSPARKTASRSRKGRTADSSAPGTDGDPTDDTSKA